MNPSTPNQPTPRPCDDGPACPVCAGALVPLRDRFRCTRCGYHVCVGCEPSVGCVLASGEE